MAKFLLLAIYLFGAAALGGAVGLFAGLPAGAGLGAVLFLFALQLQTGADARKARRALGREIAGLKRASAGIEMALVETRTKMEEMEKAVEARATAQGPQDRLRAQGPRKPDARIRRAHLQPGEGRACARAAARRRGARLSRFAGRDRPARDHPRLARGESRRPFISSPSSSLPQRKLRYYEGACRGCVPRTGSVIMPAQYIRIAAPAGLMSVVDNLLLFRCVQIVRRLTQKHRDVGVFCNISGDTLTDAEFFPQFLEYMQANRDLAGQIVFEFAQDAVVKAERRARRI